MTPATFTGERVGFVDLKRLFLWKQEMCSSTNRTTPIRWSRRWGTRGVRVWLGHKVLGRRAKTLCKTMTQLASGGECACLLDQLRGCLWRILFHWGQITISNVCNKGTHFLVEKIGVSRNLPHLINKSHWKVSFLRNLLFLVKIAHDENLPTNTCGCAGEDKDHRDLKSNEVNFKYPE